MTNAAVERPKMKFLVRHGKHYDHLPHPDRPVAAGNQPREYPKGSVVETHEDLVAKFGDKYERILETADAAREGFNTAFTDSGTPQAGENEEQYMERMRRQYRERQQVKPTAPLPTSTLGTLEAMTPQELQRLAADNNIDIRAAKGKHADMLRIIAAGLSR